MHHLSGRKHIRFLFLFLSLLGIGVVVLIYQEVTRIASEEPKGPVTSGDYGVIHNDHRPNLLLRDHGEVPIEAADDMEKTGLYSSRDQIEAGGEGRVQSNKEENWEEYTTNVRDPVNDRFYNLLKTGGSQGLSKDQLYRPRMESDNTMYNFESAGDNERNSDQTRQLPNNGRLLVRYGQNNSKQTILQNGSRRHRVGQAVLPGQDTKAIMRRVVPPAPHSLYRQPGSSARYLVYVCDSDNLCGGWGDRQRGMISTYFLSRLVGRQLKVVMATPCDLINFYIPNRVPWVLARGQLDAFTNATVNVFTAKARKQVNSFMLDRDFNELYPQQVVYMKTNQDYYKRLEKNPFYQDIVRKWSGLARKTSRFQWAWKDLMRPSPRLLAQLERVLGSAFLVRRKRLAPNKGYMVHSLNDVANNSLVCAHVRFGKNPSFPNDNERLLFSLSDLPLLFNFMLSKGSSRNARFYLASDYQLIRDKAREFFGKRLLNVGVKVTHIDRQRSGEDACSGFESALLDQQILSLCDVLLVSRSGFSIHASYMAPAPQEVFVVENGGIHEFLPF